MIENIKEEIILEEKELDIYNEYYIREKMLDEYQKENNGFLNGLKSE